MIKIKSIFRKIISCIATVALLVAVSSVASACFFVAYQPDVPKELQ